MPLTETQYLVPSVLVGAVVILDGVILLKHDGRCRPNSLASVTTSIELVWALFTIAALFLIEFSKWYIIAPGIYAVHNVTGWMGASALMAVGKMNVDTEEEMAIPIWYVWVGTGVGIAFTILCVAASYQIFAG